MFWTENMYLEGFRVIYDFFLSRSYVLDHSESIDIQINSIFFGVRPKKFVAINGGGQNFANRVFFLLTPSLLRDNVYLKPRDQ